FTVIFILRRIIRKKSVDIVQSFMFTANFWTRLSLLFRKRPIIISCERSVDTWKTSLHRVIDKFFSTFTAKIVANSKAVRDFIVNSEGIDPRKVAVIQNGVDERFLNTSYTGFRQQLLHSLDRDAIDYSLTYRYIFDKIFKFRGAGVILGSICRFNPRKDLENLIRAFRIVKDKFPHSHLLLMGDARLPLEFPYKKRILKLISELSLNMDITHFSFCEDILPILALIDIYVQSSEIEGFPNTVLEAMALKKAVVATDVGGTAEIIEDKLSGFLVPPGDPEKLADSILLLAKDPNIRKQTGIHARNRIMENFTIHKMIEKYEELFVRMVGGKV
ncbi:MAG: glycosyltransferase, partial [Fidelibacterota bacterium]